MGSTRETVNQQYRRMFVLAVVHTAVQADTAVTAASSVHLRHVLPLALVRTKTRLARRRGFHVNKYRQSQSGWSLPCLHGRRRITQTAVGSVPFSHKYVEQQWKNKINICGQHCCTGTKLNTDILPDSASYVRQQGQRQTGEQQ